MEDLPDGYKVFDSPCSTCLFGPNKIVSEARKKEVIKNCLSRNSHFICHEATKNNHDIACRGFFDRYSTNLERMCGRIGMIFMIQVKDYMDGLVYWRKPTTKDLSGRFDSAGRIK